MLSKVNETSQAILDWMFIVAVLGQFPLYLLLGQWGFSPTADTIPPFFVLFIITGVVVGKRLARYGRPRILICTLIGGYIGPALSAGLILFLPALGAICGAAYSWAEAREVAATPSDMDNVEGGKKKTIGQGSFDRLQHSLPRRNESNKPSSQQLANQRKPKRDPLANMCQFPTSIRAVKIDMLI